MKKVLTVCLLVGMFFFPAKSFSQGIESGQSAANFYIGFGTALNKSGLEVDGQDLSWGNIGGGAGFSYLYSPTPYFGLGADIHMEGFQGSESFEDVRGRWHWHTFSSDFEMYTMHLMGVGRININPGSRVRLYIPFGAGIALSESRMTYRFDDHKMYDERNYDSSFSWYAGLGLEFETDNGRAWGLEARYNAFEHSYEDLKYYVGGKIINDDAKREYVSLVLKFQF